MFLIIAKGKANGQKLIELSFFPKNEVSSDFAVETVRKNFLTDYQNVTELMIEVHQEEQTIHEFMKTLIGL
jgi:hypothetical protein